MGSPMWSHRLQIVGMLSVLSGSLGLRIFVGLVPFVQFRWCGGVVCVGGGGGGGGGGGVTFGGVALFGPAVLLGVILLHGCFSRVLALSRLWGGLWAVSKVGGSARMRHTFRGLSC